MGSVAPIRSARRGSLERAFPVMAAVYGHKFGVKVQVQGRDAYTNGDVINIPNLDPPQNPNREWLDHELRHLEAELREAAFGYLAHESAHVRWTDFEVYGSSAPNPLRQTICNIIEDIRIETLIRQVFPGTRDTLMKVVDYLLASGGFEAPTEETPPAGVLQAYLLYSLRCDVLGQEQLADLADKSEALLHKTFPAGACTRLIALLQVVPQLGSTRDALTLTDDILRMLKEEQEKEQQKQQGQQQQDQEDDDQDGSGQSGSSAGGDGDEEESDGSAEGDASASSGSDGNNNDDSDLDDQQSVASAAGGGSGASDGGAADPEQAAKQLQALMDALEAGAEDLQKDMMEQLKADMADHATDDVGPWDCTMAHADDHLNLHGRPGTEVYQYAAAESGKLRAKLMGLVQASQMNRPWHTTRGQRLEGNRLARTRVGDFRIFRQQAKKVAPNAAFQILIDDSGSMYGPAQIEGRQALTEDIAKEAAMALSMALEQINGVTVGATIFPAAYSDTSVWDILKHGQSVRHAVRKFAASSQGGTPMTGAIAHCARTLIQQKGENKVIIVLTDGDPNCFPSCRRIIEQCQDSGIRVIGIGIQHHGVRRLFDESVVINELADLRHELFNLARQSLIG